MTTTTQNKQRASRGTVVRAFGNLLHATFDGDVRQGEVAYVLLNGTRLKAEVIEIAGKEVKLQVFEDTRNVHLGTEVEFTTQLLEAELGPGLLSSIVDGLQNPLEQLAHDHGYYLPRGVYVSSLDRNKHWEFTPEAKVGDFLKRGELLGTVIENRFKHHIMVPFLLPSTYEIVWMAPQGSYTVDHVIARAKDSDGLEHAFTMVQRWPIKNQLMEGVKVRPFEMMVTGSRIIDTQFSLLRGGTFCTPGPFGAGKTVLQHHLAKYSSVDIVIVCACGERAGEVVEVLREFPHLVDPYNNEPLMKRTVIICNTSSMPVAARESSIYLGVTIAEYYRQMGLNVLLLADSTSRWAQAMREMSGRLEEIPGEEAFPAYLASRIAAFYERSGVIQLPNGSFGSLTIGGAVSPAGGNFEEPVTQATLAVVGAFLGLSRERSDARRYPAVDPLISWSKYIKQVATLIDKKIPEWGRAVIVAARTLKEGDEIRKRMEVVGEEGIAIQDMITYLKSELYDFVYLQQNAFDKEDAYCPLDRQIEMVELIYRVLKADLQHFTSHDEARHFFLALQNRLKNMNYLAWDSGEYRHVRNEIFALIEAENGVAVG